MTHDFKFKSENGGKLPIELCGIDNSTFKVYKKDPAKKIVHGDFKPQKIIYFETSESKNLNKQEDNTSILENETVRDLDIGKMEKLDATRVDNLRAGPGRNSDRMTLPSLSETSGLNGLVWTSPLCQV